MAHCTTCGKPNPDTAKFCTGCGAILTSKAINPTIKTIPKNTKIILITVFLTLSLVTAAYFIFFNKNRTQAKNAHIADTTTLAVPNTATESPSTAGSLSFTDLNGKLVYRSDCFVVITGSFAEEIYAINEVTSMKANGYTQSGYLWRMDYPSINDKYLYSTFLGPFQTYEECKMTLMPYKSSHVYAYGIKISYENNRTEIR